MHPESQVLGRGEHFRAVWAFSVADKCLFFRDIVIIGRLTQLTNYRLFIDSQEVICH